MSTKNINLSGIKEYLFFLEKDIEKLELELQEEKKNAEERFAKFQESWNQWHFFKKQPMFSIDEVERQNKVRIRTAEDQLSASKMKLIGAKKMLDILHISEKDYS